MTGGAFAAPDLHRLMFGLLYPAVLGTFFFSLLPALFGGPNQTTGRPATGKTVAGCLVVLHFVVDFHLTSSLPSKDYSFGGFVVDLLILIALFQAFDALNVSRIDQSLDVRRAATALALTYILFLAWSFLTLEATLDYLPLWCAEATGLLIFTMVAIRRSESFLFWSLIVMSSLMAVLGSMAVGPLRIVAGGGT
jgi:hypothetical protein